MAAPRLTPKQMAQVSGLVAQYIATRLEVSKAGLIRREHWRIEFRNQETDCGIRVFSRLPSGAVGPTSWPKISWVVLALGVQNLRTGGSIVWRTAGGTASALRRSLDSTGGHSGKLVYPGPCTNCPRLLW